MTKERFAELTEPVLREIDVADASAMKSSKQETTVDPDLSLRRSRLTLSSPRGCLKFFLVENVGSQFLSLRQSFRDQHSPVACECA
jgi:hypothetical protein